MTRGLRRVGEAIGRYTGKANESDATRVALKTAREIMTRLCLADTLAVCRRSSVISSLEWTSAPCGVVADNGDIDIAKNLTDVAISAGCDAIKFHKRTIKFLCQHFRRFGDYKMIQHTINGVIEWPI